jgi:hypothetical protein
MAYAVLPSVRSRTTRATTSSGVERGSAYWQAGWDWIAAQREPLGKLLEADSAAADAVAAATRRLEEQRAEPPTREPKWPIVRVVEPSAARPLAADASSFLADHVFGMPYHFKWNWWHGAGPVFL